ncbi:hypothetical protein [Spirosoma pulveris]
MNTIRQPQPLPGDYYGVVYKGSLVLPVLFIIVFAVALWWFLKKRR